MFLSGQALESGLVQAYLPVKTLIYALGYTSGVWVTLLAIFKLKRAGIEGDSAQVSVGSCLILFLIGAALVTLPQMIDAGSMTAFGTVAPDQSSLAYTPTTSNPLLIKATAFIHALSYFFNMVGMFAVLRAFYIWHECTLGYRNSTFWKAMFHFLGGVVAVNNRQVAEMIASLLSGFNG